MSFQQAARTRTSETSTVESQNLRAVTNLEVT
jgi:hypothetical protein